MTTPRKFICIGHRGAKGYEPENTIRSFEKALEIGVPWVEFDIWNVEGRPLVIHDHRLERLTNGTGYLPELKFDYVRSLDAGQGQSVPTLQEVLELLCGKVGVNIELKGVGTAETTMRVVGDYLDAGRLSYENLLISSFNHQELVKVKSVDPKVKTGALIYGQPLKLTQFAEELSVYSVNQSVEFVTQEFIEDAHARGFKVFVYTVNHEDDLRRMISLGADGVFSDYPDRALAIARNVLS